MGKLVSNSPSLPPVLRKALIPKEIKSFGMDSFKTVHSK
jgi:hypothetical protein